MSISLPLKNPISHEILKVVASHVITGDKNDILLLDSVSIDDTTTPFDIPPAREVVAERFYLPAWVCDYDNLDLIAKKNG